MRPGEVLNLNKIIQIEICSTIESCQEGENAICGIEGVPEGVLNPCCKGFKCYKWNSDENGYSFCMNKTAALIPENGNCKVSGSGLNENTENSILISSGVQGKL